MVGAPFPLTLPKLVQENLQQCNFSGIKVTRTLRADFWESVRQSNKTVNTHFGSQASMSDYDIEDLEMSSVYKDGKTEPFSEGVSEKIFYSTI